MSDDSDDILDMRDRYGNDLMLEGKSLDIFPPNRKDPTFLEGRASFRFDDEQATALAVALIQATPGSTAEASIGTTLRVPFAYGIAHGVAVVQREHAIEAALALIRAAARKDP